MKRIIIFNFIYIFIYFIILENLDYYINEFIIFLYFSLITIIKIKIKIKINVKIYICFKMFYMIKINKEH